MGWRLLNTGPGNVYFNMALDEAIFCLRKKNLTPSTIRFYSWDKPAVTFGYFQQSRLVQNTFDGFNLPFVRRITGGGSVFHNCEITFSVICASNEILSVGIRESYYRISTAIVSGLRKLGLNANVSKVGFPEAQFCFSTIQPGDIVIKERKLAGGSQRRSAGILLHQGSILLKQNKNFIRFYNKGISLNEVVDRKVTFNDAKEFIVHGFSKEFGIIIEEGELLDQEKKLSENLIDKYKSEEWNKRY